MINFLFFKQNLNFLFYERLNNKRTTKEQQTESMGNSSSTPSNFSNEEKIRTEMLKYASQWKGKGQTELFRVHIPKEAVDFTEKHVLLGLDKIFTSEKIKTAAGFNSLHLFRTSQEEVDIPVFSSDGFTVLHALGEPGRDLGEDCTTKVSHMMIVKHKDEGNQHAPITFNEMLPSVQEEVDDLEKRIEVGKKAYDNLQKNVALSECGEKVKAKATKMGIPHTVGIREFLGRMILGLTPEFKSSPPGYKLMNGKNNISENHQSVQEMIENTFTDPSLETCACIQPPSLNSQMLSHIHLFRIKSIPKVLDENYYDCEIILKIKKELLTKVTDQSMSSPVSEGRPTTPDRDSINSPRAKTPPRSDEEEPLARTMTTSRTTTPPRNGVRKCAPNSGLTRQNTRAVTPERC